LKLLWSERLVIKCEKNGFSKIGFEFNLCRYALVTDVPEMCAEVGTRASTILELDNPLDEVGRCRLNQVDP
jgi:hypothetical protein